MPTNLVANGIIIEHTVVTQEQLRCNFKDIDGIPIANTVRPSDPYLTPS
jgi:hypothetical protein